MKHFCRLALRLLQAAHGRVVAGLLLAVAVVALFAVETTPLLGVRQLLFDHYQRLMPRERGATPVQVVAIDENSLRTYGQWPWPRDLMARLIEKIAAGGPLAIGIDILFIEPDRLAPAQLASRLPGLPEGALAGAADPDTRLAAALAGGPSVLALSGSGGDVPTARQPLRSTPLTSRGGDTRAALPAFPAALLSLPALERAAAGQGLINAPPDRSGSGLDAEHGVLRRLPLLARIGDATVPTLGLEMVRLAQGRETVVAEAGVSGQLRNIGVGDHRLPVSPDGLLLMHFGHYRGDRYLSAADVLSDQTSPDIWRGKYVLLGLTGQGLVDRVVTPLGEKTPGVDIHAQFIESLLAGDALRRPAWMTGLELAALLTGAILLIVGVPRLRPTYAAYLGAAVALALGAVGYGAFALGRWLFDSASVVILLNPLFIALLGNTLALADQRRRHAERDLQASREAAARDAGELDAARRIQMGLLPDLAALAAAEPRIAVAACLEPAKAVGGDFYDCFPLDANRLCLLVGDVSGKGVPASLFMTVTKVLAAALARRTANLGDALRQVQEELDRNNPEMMFVTTFVAVLELDSGIVRHASAGHDAPLLVRRGIVAPLASADAGGPPLCTVPGFAFAEAQEHLQRGDLLCLFTDGVSEACNGRDFFGKERLQATVQAAGDDTPQQVVAALREAVRTFEAGQPPADDLTILALRWHGPA